MKAGGRALGIAESYRESESTLAGAVVRASRVVDGLAYATCTVGGTDATAAVEHLWQSLDRPDVRYLFLAGVAPAWFNLFDLHALHEHLDRPVLSVSFEASSGLEDAIREHFDGQERDDRMATYRAQPARREVALAEETVFVRSVGFEGCDETSADVVRAFTPEGGRPEPLRVARLAARAGDDLRHADRRD
ncbi:DUF99 family protein [Halobacteriales archaeon Cl-PHB]